MKGHVIPENQAIAPFIQQGQGFCGKESIRRADVSNCFGRNAAGVRDGSSGPIQLSLKDRSVFQREWEMTITVECKLMSTVMDLLHEMWISLNAFSDQKERGTDVMLRQYVQHLGCVARMRSIVEGQCDLRAGGIPIKQDAGAASLQVPIYGADEGCEHSNCFFELSYPGRQCPNDDG